MRSSLFHTSTLLTIFISSLLHAQPFLSSLHAGSDDPVFTTYAAPLTRSQYKADQGYTMMWCDPEKGVGFESHNGPCFTLAFQTDSVFRNTLQSFYREPVITVSYSNLVKFHYYPFRDIRVEVFFDVFSSTIAISDIIIENESPFEKVITFYPCLYSLSPGEDDPSTDESDSACFHFSLYKPRDRWMKEHDIPVAEELNGLLHLSVHPDESRCTVQTAGQIKSAGDDLFRSYKQFLLDGKPAAAKVLFIKLTKSVFLRPGQNYHFRIIVGVEDKSNDQDAFVTSCQAAQDIDLNGLLRDDEKLYSGIPKLNLANTDYEALYWNAFSLLRQCMMPPEGECHYNYYIFSREPKWGWGYGGQVFHESLSMLAYAMMDGAGAMNSQRVFIERQHKDGYINYRTGPYLDETIPYDNQLTTSAPWFSYENNEIFRITGDTGFLKQAYDAGKRLYDYFIVHRDSDHDGLCEWGGHGELESVRDARVAVWDEVGWPSYFECLDLNAILVKEARALEAMAHTLGLKDEERHWDTEAAHRTQFINSTMWDTVDGFYYHVNRTDHSFTFKSKDDLKRKEIIGFLPLWAGIATKEQAARLVRHLTDMEEFGRSNGIPSLSAADSYYNPIGYWNGPVWIQWNYLVFRGLLDYGYDREAAGLAQRVCDAMVWHLHHDHVFWELYSADDHRAGWNETYIWAGIVARMLSDMKENGLLH